MPDSLLKDICAYISDNGNDVIAANEGASIALAAGYHLATGKTPLVYLQNSGFGNAINPLASLVDKEVYSIPLLLMIGWRGEPGVKDEPQHIKQGRISEDLLKTLEIPHEVLSNDHETSLRQIDAAFESMKATSSPYALLVKADTFAPYKLKKKVMNEYALKREDAIKIVIDSIGSNDIIVSTTGKSSREVFEYRANKTDPHNRDFLTVGCMGHASQIALGIALNKTDHKIICLDGDGAFIMHMGSAAIIGDLAPENFYHVLINNGSHDSVGGQPTVGFNISFTQIAKACGYKTIFSASEGEDIQKLMPEFLGSKGPVLFEIRTAGGARNDLGRPTIKPIDNKKEFMNNLNKKFNGYQG